MTEIKVKINDENTIFDVECNILEQNEKFIIIEAKSEVESLLNKSLAELNKLQRENNRGELEDLPLKLPDIIVKVSCFSNEKKENITEFDDNIFAILPTKEIIRNSKSYTSIYNELILYNCKLATMRLNEVESIVLTFND